MVRSRPSIACAGVRSGKLSKRQLLTLQAHRQQLGLSEKQQGDYHERRVIRIMKETDQGCQGKFSYLRNFCRISHMDTEKNYSVISSCSGFLILRVFIANCPCEY